GFVRRCTSRPHRAPGYPPVDFNIYLLRIFMLKQIAATLLLAASFSAARPATADSLTIDDVMDQWITCYPNVRAADVSALVGGMAPAMNAGGNLQTYSDAIKAKTGESGFYIYGLKLKRASIITDVLGGRGRYLVT